jgi:UDP-glucose-4-epimerase GalE
VSVLITGGAGYIGAITADLLARRGDSVVIVDSLELGYRAAIGDLPLLVANIADTDAITRAVQEHAVDAVVHFAGYKAAGESVVNPGKYFDNNVGASARLIDALAHAGVTRFVFSSSAAVYGTPAHVPVSEDEPLHPESPYGESKLMTERMLGWYDQTHALRSVSLRYFNAAGATLDGERGEDWSHSANLVPVAIKAAMGASAPLKVFGTDYPTPDGTAIRDYIHVLDLAAAHAAALDYLAGGGATTALNLGTGRGSSVLEVVAALTRASGADVPLAYAPRRAGDPTAVFADNARAKAILGWTPQYDLDEIVSSAWRWRQRHPSGYA